MSLESARALLEGKGLIAGLAGQAKRAAMSVAVTTGLVAETTATGAATTATLGLNAAMLLNPAVAITAAILALGAAITYLVVTQKKSTEEWERSSDFLKRFKSFLVDTKHERKSNHNILSLCLEPLRYKC
jgi:hypothetical protein